jgi:hypothetical protein
MVLLDEAVGGLAPFQQMKDGLVKPFSMGLF